MPQRWIVMLFLNLMKCRNQILDLCTLARHLGRIASMMDIAQIQVCELRVGLVFCVVVHDVTPQMLRVCLRWAIQLWKQKT